MILLIIIIEEGLYVSGNNQYGTLGLDSPIGKVNTFTRLVFGEEIAKISSAKHGGQHTLILTESFYHFFFVH